MKIEDVLVSKTVNLSSIKSYFSDEKSLLIELITVFLSDTKPKIEILENNLDNLNFSQVKDISHFFKSSFGLMGIDCIDDLDILEDLAIKKENPKLILESLESVVYITKKSIAEYEVILNNLTK